MKQSTIIVFVFICIFLSCKTAEKKEQPHSLPKSEYPSIVDSLGINDLYNETKWLMYCYECDDTLKIVNYDTLKQLVTFGMLELKFDTVNISKESKHIEILFNFYYNSIALKGDATFQCPIWGMVYENKIGRRIFYVVHADNMNYRNDSCAVGKPCHSRFVNPLQPEVVKYINDNKTKIDPWFYREAKKRGVIKE